MGTKNTLLAGLYLLFGMLGALPCLFLFPSVALGMAWWGLVLRTANPPVPLERFLEGVGQGALEALPGFPFGLAGIGLLAFHCALSFPCLFTGMALLKSRPGTLGWIRRVGILVLPAFPFGTALGLFTFWSLARSPSTAGLSGDSSAGPFADPSADPPVPDLPSLGDRAAAALCYLVPVVYPLFVIASARDKAFQRLHAIQSLAFYLVLVVVASLGYAFEMLAGYVVSPFVTGAGILVLVLLAGMAFVGTRFKFPRVGDFAERWEGGVAEIVEKAIDQWKEAGALAVHRANLARTPAEAGSAILPKIAGTTGFHGFVQRTGHTVDWFTVVACAIPVLLIVALVWATAGQVATRGWSRVNWAIAIPGLLVFGGFCGLVLFMGLRQAVSVRLNGAELAVARWPPRLGEKTRARLRVTSRKGARVERISTSLRCLETICWRDRDNKPQSSRVAVQQVPFPDMTPLAAADGSFSVEWTFRVPLQAPPSFVGTGTAIGWVLLVELRIAGAPDSTLAFDVLVVPEVAGP